jgi:hypothetical protein
VAAYLKKRLLNIHKSDLGDSLFINDTFYWDALKNKCIGQGKENKKIHVDQFLRLKRVTKMLDRHESYLINSIKFIEDHSNQSSGCHRSYFLSSPLIFPFAFLFFFLPCFFFLFYFILLVCSFVSVFGRNQTITSLFQKTIVLFIIVICLGSFITL